MKKHNSFKRTSAVVKFFAILFLAAAALVSCTEEDSGEPYFYIEGDPTGLSVDMNENTSSFTVRSNRPWQLVVQGEDSWTRAFPDEGEDDGIFSLIVQENSGFVDRVMNFAFIVDGEEQPVLFRIEQEANVPYIVIDGAESGISVQSAAGEFSIQVTANVDWHYSVDDESWLEELDVTESSIRFYAAKNSGEARSVTLTLTANDFPEVQQQVVITQSAGYIILEEDFNWLSYGSTVPYEWENAVRYDSWTQEERDRGWLVTPNEYSNNEPLCYSMIGYVKLGKTNYGGDIISPALNIDGTADVKVTFKSAVYISAAGTVDDRVLKVFALNAGTTSVSEFSIDNVPNSLAEDEAGIINDIWDPARSYSFTITGATSETRIKFLGGDYALAGVGQGKNRIFLDDIKVELIQK